MSDEKDNPGNTIDYKDTLNLPSTDFQMKASLPKREPEMLKGWESDGLYGQILSKGGTKGAYTLHDGPPYANGHIHIGHALNKILKDIIIRSKTMEGFEASYIPGWDCHGLPIELQVEKKLKNKKLDKTATKLDIRRRCRGHATEFVEIQREEFKRLGILGRWEEPYLTMNFKYQAAILRELGTFVEEDLIYKGKKPVHWCSSCITALAEAEVEHGEKVSPTVYVKFDVQRGPDNAFASGLFEGMTEGGLSFVIWTTTPWTLPANMAIAVHPDLLYKVVNTPAGNLIINEELVGAAMESFGFGEGEYEVYERSFKGSDLEGIKCSHPWVGRGVNVYTADFVTNETGTGTVHIAPGHGQDDYELGLREGLDIYTPVNKYGKFTNEVPEFEGNFVFKANKGIIELLKGEEKLLATEEVTHSYPHCWRCKNPVIFRATEQWFVPMDKTLGEKGVDSDKTLRQSALDSIKKVEWVPNWGMDRIYSMIEGRPDWCLSRQRAWGVPIPALICKGCRHTFLDKNLIDHLAERVEAEGADIWFDSERGERGDLIPDGTECPKCSGSDFEREEDILDVWFDSGVSYSAVMEASGFKTPVDLYLEGSDQHRGWFHSSLLTSTATRGRAPYKGVLTHGFVVDGQGKKMSKSAGNVVSPFEVIDEYGADVLRLWVSSEDYRDDLKISKEIIKRQSEAYRRVRNTFRYILGNISDFDPNRDMVEYSDLDEDIDRLMLHRLARLTEKVTKAYKNFEFHIIYHSVNNFCTVDLSSFYLDYLKDRLYTSKAGSKSRRGAQSVMYRILDSLLRLTAPVLAFTTQEAWELMPKAEGTPKYVHLADMPGVDESWINDDLDTEWVELLAVKEEISKALEGARREKVIGHSLDGHVNLVHAKGLSGDGAGDHQVDFERKNSILRDMVIVSRLSDGETPGGNLYTYQTEGDKFKDLKIEVGRAEGEKCERCWHYSIEVGESGEHPTICRRCVEAVS